jgi:branched-chain amino acid aminotransferase
MIPWINFNGKFYRADAYLLGVNNRAFCYGDALFETMRWHDKKILFFHDHVDRLFSGMQFLKMKIPKKYSAAFLQNQVYELIRRKNITSDARIRLQVFRNEGGYYTPTDNSVQFVIAAESIRNDNYVLNEKGITLDIFSELQKSKHRLSNFKTSNCLIYVLAGIFAKENKIDDCLILNTDGNIADSISSNIFLLKNETLITPPLADGCVDGLMRKNILRMCLKKKIKTEEKSIQVNTLLEADEILLTNVIQGIRGVKQFREINYKNDFSKFLSREINFLGPLN